LTKKSLEQIRIDEIDHVFMEDFKFYLKFPNMKIVQLKSIFLIKGCKYAVSKGYTKERKIEEYRVDKAKEKILYHLLRKSLTRLIKWT
jgi:hypothetical protein